MIILCILSTGQSDLNSATPASIVRDIVLRTVTPAQRTFLNSIIWDYNLLSGSGRIAVITWHINEGSRADTMSMLLFPTRFATARL